MKKNSIFKILAFNDREYDSDWDYSSCYLNIEFTLVYVSPEFRGLGYGFALATIRWQICTKQMHQILEKFKGTDIILEPIIHSDWASEEGEKLTMILNGEIEAYTLLLHK